MTVKRSGDPRKPARVPKPKPMSLPGVKAPARFVRERGVGPGASPSMRYVPPPKPGSRRK